jgi:DNA-binding CsgD family transcriptional regulator
MSYGVLIPASATCPQKGDGDQATRRNPDIMKHLPLLRKCSSILAERLGIDPDDAFQGLALWLLEHQHQYNPSKGNFSTWVMSSGQLGCRRALMQAEGAYEDDDRQWRRRPTTTVAPHLVPDTRGEDAEDVDDRKDVEDRAKLVQAFIAGPRFSDSDRRIIVLASQGLSCASIGRQLYITSQAAQQRLRSIRVRIRRRFKWMPNVPLGTLEDRWRVAKRPAERLARG